jgi:hypothetical protein
LAFGLLCLHDIWVLGLGLGFGVEDLGFEVWFYGFRVMVLEFKVSGLGFGVWFRVCGFSFWDLVLWR